MKKTIFSLLMLAAMFMVASCGSKSNSGEATEVTFTDPAIVYGEGLDLTSYFSAESLTQPAIKKSDDYYYITTTIKLKVLKNFGLVRENDLSKVQFYVRFCDKNGSLIASGTSYIRIKHNETGVTNFSEGTVNTLVIFSNENDLFESNMKEILDKVEKIEVSISTEETKFAETAETKG